MGARVGAGPGGGGRWAWWVVWWAAWVRRGVSGVGGWWYCGAGGSRWTRMGTVLSGSEWREEHDAGLDSRERMRSARRHMEPMARHKVDVLAVDAEANRRSDAAEERGHLQTGGGRHIEKPNGRAGP